MCAVSGGREPAVQAQRKADSASWSRVTDLEGGKLRFEMDPSEAKGQAMSTVLGCWKENILKRRPPLIPNKQERLQDAGE